MNRIKSLFTNYILNNIGKDSEMDEMNLIISNLYIIVSVFLAVVTFIIEKRDILYIKATIFIDIFWILFLYVILKFKAYKIFAVLFSILVNMFVFPAFFLMTDTVYNGGALFFCLGIVTTFFVIWERYVYIIAAFELLWDIFIMRVAMSNDLFVRAKINTNIAGTGILVSFLFAAVVPLFVIIFQTVSYDKEHKNVIKAKEVIDEAKLNKSRFLTNMTHEIRTPMNAIIGMNELLLRETIDPVSKELGGLVKESSNQLLKIVNNVLEFSKLDSGSLDLYPQKYSFKDMISGVVEAFSYEFAGDASQFIVSIDPHIPLFLFGDSVRIRQVFMYLLFSSVNKRKSTRMALNISSEIDPETNTVEITCRISESGSGLSASEIEAMMSAYTKYDSRLKSEYKGMGLELSICKEILESMDGDLSVDSIEGVGTAVNFKFRNYIIADDDMIRINASKEPSVLVYSNKKEEQDFWMGMLKGFRVSLHFVNGPNAFKNIIETRTFSQIFIPNEFYDILRNTIESAEIENKTYIITDRVHVYSDFGKCRIIHYPLTCINVADAINGFWDENKYKIVIKKDAIVYPNAKVLIVDDSIVNLKVLRGILKSFEIEPDMAKDAQEALDEINRKIYDLIILDQIMPGVDGIELLHTIRGLSNTNSRIPILCATADFGPEVGRRLVAEGFQDYLAKPVQQFYLERMLRRYLPEELAENPANDEEIKTDKKEAPEFENDPVEINFDKGLETVGGLLDAYCAVLNTYYKEGIRKIEDIKNELSDGNISLYVVDVHALKSSSASIGALGLSERFKALEFAGREDKLDYIKNNTDETLGFFETVLESVKSYLIENNMFVSEDEKVDLGEVVEISIETVLEMQDAINKINLRRCEEIISELSSQNYGSDINSMVKSIKSSFEMFDYIKVKAYITDLIDFIN